MEAKVTLVERAWSFPGERSVVSTRPALRALRLRIADWVEAAPTSRFVWRSLLVAAAVHAVLWSVVASEQQLPLARMFGRFDVGWYSAIVRDGYSGQEWAFFPLWPALVAVVWRVVPLALPLLQALLAASLFVVTVRLFFTDEKQRGLLAPETRLGWLLFLLAPASYVFHTGHTESLFLLISMTALSCAFRGSWVWAAVFAGLAALTRNQGVFLAVGIAIAAARSAPSGRGFLRFVLSGVISAALFGLYPGFQYLWSGDPLLSVKAQANWSHATGIRDYFYALVLGNAGTLRYEGFRHPIFVALLVASFMHFRARRDFALVVYFLLSLSIMLAQRNLANLFRFSVSLAPLVFFAGDWLAHRRKLWPLAVLGYSVYLHLMLTSRYPQNLWAY
jgi:hypothetical protein